MATAPILFNTILATLLILAILAAVLFARGWWRSHREVAALTAELADRGMRQRIATAEEDCTRRSDELTRQIRKLREDLVADRGILAADRKSQVEA